VSLMMGAREVREAGREASREVSSTVTEQREAADGRRALEVSA